MKFQTTPTVFLLAIGLWGIFDHVFCCELHWNRFSDHCYRIYEQPAVTQHTARRRCMMEGSDLVSITDTDVLDFIAQHTAQTASTKFWVGLRRNHSRSTEGPDHGLEWADGTTAQNQSWVRIPGPGEYIDYGPDPSDFLLMMDGCFAYDGALVVKTACWASLAYICGHPVPDKPKREACHPNVENEHSFIGDATGNCLFRTPTLTTKNKTEEFCQQYGGHFVDLDAIVRRINTDMLRATVEHLVYHMQLLEQQAGGHLEPNLMRDGFTAFYDHKVLSNDGSKYWTNFSWNGTAMFYSTGEAVPKNYPVPLVEGTGSCITVQFNFTDILMTTLYQTECGDQAYVVCSTDSKDSNTQQSTTQPTRHQEMLLSDDPQTVCPEGYNWKADRKGDYCYWETSFETDQRSWEDAEKFCQSYGGHLGSFHSVEEEKIGLSFQYGSLAHPYWIGLALDPDTETYKWTDGSPLDYNNWAPGHPNHRDKRLRCVAMHASEKHWESSLCGILSWFICKVPKKTGHPVPVTPTPTPLESCEDNLFEKKMSYYFGGSCYFVGVQSFSWHRAKQFCENEGGTLASIHSTEEIGFLLRLLHESSLETNRVWIGLNSFGAEATFQWTDYSAVDFTYFADHEPDNYQYQEKCVNMNNKNGEWKDENCNAGLGFICKRFNDTSVSVTIPTTMDPSIGNCKQGWIPHNDRCYYIGGKREKDRMNWTEAVGVCQKHGGYLASIRDEKDQSFLSYLLQTLGVDGWIGLHDTIQSGRYYWMDNSDVSYTNWAPGEPSFFGVMEDCVKMVYDHLESGVWKDDECHRRIGYICQNNKDIDLPPPPSERGLNCLHPEGWLKLDKMCFKMFAGSLLTWKEAEKSCLSEGGHLVSVSDQRVKAVVSYLATEVNQPFFIGLRYDRESQKVEWLNNFPVMLTNWEKNEPSSMTEDTCFASTSEGFWKKYACDEKMPYVCQVTTGKPNRLRQYIGKCPPSSRLWVPGSKSYCYMLENDLRSDWFTANLMCFRYGSHLLSIHSKEEVEDLKKIMKPGIRSIFLGLMRNKKGGFTWTDDTPVNFVDWDEDEPSNSQDQCVEMSTSTMKWRIASCLTKKHFVCMDTKGTLMVEDPESAGFASESEGLSTGAICAVVFTILIGVVLIVAAAIYRKRSSSAGGPQFRRHTREQSVSFENALYNVGRSSMEFTDEDKS